MDVYVSSIEFLPIDLLASCFLHLHSFRDLAVASEVCRKWREAVKHAFMYKDKLSFSGMRMHDSCVARLVEGANSLQELNISSSRWGCNITDKGLKRISFSLCCPKLISISLWGMTAITDEGVIQLVSRAHSLQHLNVGGTFITDTSIFAIAEYCQKLKVLNLWGCRRVTEQGLLALGTGCSSLYSINVWGLQISRDFYKYIVSMNPHLRLIGSSHLNRGTDPYWQAVQQHIAV